VSQTTENQWTIKRLLDWTANYLNEHGSQSGRLDAEILLAQSLKCQRIELYTRFDQIPAPEQLTAYRGMVKRRADGAPVAYLVGYREFFSLPFAVNESVLIPRPETELLVIQALDLLKQQAVDGQVLQVLDMGTGSGNIAVSIAKHADNCRLTAVDISDAALEVAKRNAQRHQVDDRIAFLQSDLFASVDASARYDLIVSNPPYIATNDKQVEAQVKNHEPHQALFAGADGMDVIARLATDATSFLKPGGRLMFEISPFIEPKCRELLESLDQYGDIQILDDLARLPRIAIAIKK
jgi:release factor glutamine methyltransferase